MPNQRHLRLTKEMIDRRFPCLPEEQPTTMPLRSEAELAETLAAFLAEKPDSGPLWLFAYGSLMWDQSVLVSEERCQATLHGWHRRFCLWMKRWRATPEKPGLMLALDKGGCCQGVAYRLSGADHQAALDKVWRREMIGYGYVARWVALRLADGRQVAAVVFVVNKTGDRYAGQLPDEEVARYLACACGHRGTSADYLLATVQHCEAIGIHDRCLWRLQERVADELSR